MRIRALVLCGAAGFLLAGPASNVATADDRTVDGAVTEPIETIDPDGTGPGITPGNIIINSGASVTIDDPGAAVTINSDNSVTLNGGIVNQSTTDGIGLEIFGGFTGNLLDEDGNPIGISGTGSIVVGGTGADGTGTPGTGNIGLWLHGGSGAFTGAIDLSGIGVSATGIGAVGVQIDQQLVGNLDLGSMNITGQGASALHTTAAINGALTINSTITVLGVLAPSPTLGMCPPGVDLDTCDPQPGAGLWVGSDVTGGILNVGPADAADPTIGGIIQVAGSSPAVLIAPDSSSLTIGVLNDDTNPGFSFVNRGTIEVAGNDPGIETTAMFIGRMSGDASSNTATLVGGIYNRGAIRAASVTGNQNATDIDPADGSARGIVIGDGGIVPTIVNDGSISALVDQGPMSADSTALLIQSGGSLTSIVNNGGIVASANTTADPDGETPVGEVDHLTAVAIRDESGTLTSLTNTGVIAATISNLNGADINHITTIAGDFSANSTTFDFQNTGVVQGDLIFGTGASTFGTDGEDDDDGLNLSRVTGSIYMGPGGTLDITIGNATLTTPHVEATNLAVGAEGIVNLTLPTTSGSDPVVTLDGDGNFAAGSKINFGYSQYAGDVASFALIHADGTLTIDDLAGATDATRPFIYNTVITNDGHDLTVDLTRKTADELGFTGNLKTIYEPAIAAIAAATAAPEDSPFHDTELGAALMRLTDEAGTAVAMQSLMPVVNGAQRNYAISLTDQFFGPVGARQRVLVTTPNQGRNLAFWGQEFWLTNQNNGGGTIPGYADSGFGVAAGADYGALSTGRYGVAFEHFNGDSVAGEPRVTKTLNNWTVFSAYANWMDEDNGLYFTTQVNGGFGSFDEKRRIIVADFTDTAQGHWTGWLAAWGATVGDVIGDDLFAIIPQASVDALYMHESAYNEHGAGAANLAIAERNNTSIRGFVGLVGRAQFELWGGYVRPELHIGYSHEFAGSPTDANVYFISAQNMHFRISGPAEPVGKFIGGGSLHFVYNNWSVGGDYDTTLGSETTSEAGSVTLTGHF